jgi:membrane protease YdiL (CAAX protease family)
LHGDPQASPPTSGDKKEDHAMRRALHAAMAAHWLFVAGVVTAPAGWWLVRGQQAAPAAPADAWALCCVLLLYPCLEECCFRGGVQPWLAARRIGRGRLAGCSATNLMTSLLFVAAHVPGQPLAWAAATLLPSLLLGALRERYGRVAPAAVLHIWFNAGLAWPMAGAG